MNDRRERQGLAPEAAKDVERVTMTIRRYILMTMDDGPGYTLLDVDLERLQDLLERVLDDEPPDGVDTDWTRIMLQRIRVLRS